ncbi:DegV domain-containing protein [Clostridium bornimense]|uniref:DegV domain-containing protein n=1 Tax=Clostridium bornimense TaxID=1216932 RepID=W6RWY3_9CLOT|nr:DegV family protein [Clostridium bornimense]CDM68144.1 DegV domain-containing protein [Clostridium bornimense]
MDKIKIITDSTCDLPQSIIDEYDIEVIPLLVTINGESYKDREELVFSEMMEKIKDSDELPTTTQINPQRFYEYYKRYIDEGYKIVSIHISSKMSGTAQSALIAKDMLDTEDIEVVDSQNVTAGLGVLVLEAQNLKEKGYGYKEIANEIRNSVDNVKSALLFTSLDNLIKGGRLSKTAGTIGNLLGIKLILDVSNGIMNVREKIRGTKKGVKSIISYIDEKGVREGSKVVFLTAGLEEVEIRETIISALKERNIDYIESEVGCVVGTHSGTNACGFFFLEKNN